MFMSFTQAHYITFFLKMTKISDFVKRQTFIKIYKFP